jgi:hypothetical protein
VKIVENVERVKRSPQKRNEKIGLPETFTPCFRRKAPALLLRDYWYRVRFKDGAELYISTLPFYMCGNNPILAFQELAREFGLKINKGFISAPFEFCRPDRTDARDFLNAVLSYSVENFNVDAIPMGGSC